MKIAVVGAGFAGLSTCWHLLQVPNREVTLFDAVGIGGGASGIATGLLHPFPGRFALRSWRSREGMEASSQLIQIAEQALGRPVALRTGIVRVAVQGAQRIAFRERTESDSDAIWMDSVQEKIPGAIDAPGLWIPSGITVFSALYLEGLWRACQARGVNLQNKRIASLCELESYDYVVLAVGHETMQFPACASLDMQWVKGQTVLCKAKEDLPCALIGIGHISPTEASRICQVGSTYEHGFQDIHPHAGVARELLQKASVFAPQAASYEVMEIRAGVRIAPRIGYQPIVAKIAPRTWILTGLGSRGLLYHALLGRQIADHIGSE